MTVAESRVPDLVERAEIEAAQEAYDAAVAAARSAVRLAEDARDEAERRVRYAPHGTLKARSMHLLECMRDLLKAEGALAALRRCAP